MTKEVMQQALEALRMPCEFWNKTQFIKVTEAIKALEEALKQKENNFNCKTHPDAPHGFVRNASHSEDRYVCECEFWEPPAQDEPIAWLEENSAKAMSDLEKQAWIQAGRDELVETYNRPLYTTPQQRKPLTNDEFLELLLRKGSRDIVAYTTFVGGSIQMQGKIGLLKSAKVIKEFIEECYGIKE